MTISEAIAKLRKKFPKKVFKIELSVWRWNNIEPEDTEVKWSVWDSDTHYHGTTLDAAVAACLKESQTVEAAEACVDVCDCKCKEVA